MPTPQEKPSVEETRAVGVVIDPKSFYRGGKTINAWREFFTRGKKGEALIYATPEGSFYSPGSFKAAIQAAEERAVKGERERCVKIVKQAIENNNTFGYQNPSAEKDLDDVLYELTPKDENGDESSY